ncbi:MAG: peptidoglycan-binding protein [Tissierella sp.]|nr:peptidoglycan-binding protein [Tissierella sp.]
MKKGKITSLFLAAVISLTPATSLAHGGKTDSSGGHKDNKNKSGLGSYHYHCGGNSAHLHKDGKCPYSSTSTKKTTSTSTTTKKSTTKTDQVELNKKIQTKLNELGYDCGEVDGSLGKKSTEAIKAFQKDKGLEVDGKAGPKTRDALGL